MRTNKMLQCAPCVAFHELFGQLFVLCFDGIQQWRHLRLHFSSKTVQAEEVEEKMKVGNRLRMFKSYEKIKKFKANLITKNFL